MPISEIRLSIPKETVSTLPIAAFSGKIEIIDEPDKAVIAVQELFNCPMIGFDTETRPSFQKGKPNKVALLQLSTEDKCFLFRLNKIGITEELCRLIECEEVKKIGLSIHDDFHGMHRISQFKPNGFVELQEYVKHFNIADISLQKIFAILFQKKISKTQRLSNWEAKELSEHQQLYAATDAWACLEIYKYLSSGQFNPFDSPFVVKEE